MDSEERIARYDKWCKLCEHKELKESEYPCDTCLFQPWNENSEKPFMWKEKRKEK